MTQIGNQSGFQNQPPIQNAAIISQMQTPMSGQSQPAVQNPPAQNTSTTSGLPAQMNPFSGKLT